MLPVAWCPPFIGLSAKLHKEWKKFDKMLLDECTKNAILEWMLKPECAKYNQFILRSSGIGETIHDRGTFLSDHFQASKGIQGLMDTATKIFTHANSRNTDIDLALVLQVRIDVRIGGHFSNEARLSKSKDRWKYEIDTPKPVARWRGISSENSPWPDPMRTLSGGNKIQDVLPSLRSFGKWLNDHIGGRCHAEWVTSSQLWIVQVDIAWPELETGCNPKTLLRRHESRSEVSGYPSSRTFKLHRIGSETKWNKLKNLDDFDFCQDRPAPQLFYAPATEVAKVLSHNRHSADLAREIAQITENRAVLRVDITGESEVLNLPRTDTVTGQDAVEWLKNLFKKKIGSIEIDRAAIILHRFLSAEACAWASASPDNPEVIVDSLWGLADGLQVLAHDSALVDVVHGSNIVCERLRYKGRFLHEGSDGEWEYVDVLPKFARWRVLTKADVVEVAERTFNISKKIGKKAVIMWFCGVQGDNSMAKNVPWYRLPNPLEDIQGRSIPYSIMVPVRTRADLNHIHAHQSPLIQFDPDAMLIRDEIFLDELIKIAKKSDATIELHGSALSHVYYRLYNENLPVIVADDWSEIIRKRRRREYWKLVRDHIPRSIRAGGEKAVEGKLSKIGIVPALLAKLVEEGIEFSQSKGDVSQAEELADLVEVIRALASHHNVRWVDVNMVAKRKRDRAGGFEEGLVLLETFEKPLESNFAKHSVESEDLFESSGNRIFHDIGRVEVVDHHIKISFPALFNLTKSIQCYAVSNGRRFRVRCHVTGTELQLSIWDLGDKSVPYEQQKLPLE